MENRVGIAPDTLADFLLEKACVSDLTGSTGYADAVFQAFDGENLSSLLANLAELDWRLKQKNTATRVLTNIWDRIDERFREGDAVISATNCLMHWAVLPFSSRTRQ